MTALKTALDAFIHAHGGQGQMFLTPIEDIVVMRNRAHMEPAEAQHMLYTPALCVVAQGAKQITIGDDVFDYEAGSALVVSVEIPALGRVSKATPAKPYLGMTIGFDIAIMREVMERLETPPSPGADRLGVFVEQLSEPLQDCITRLARLLTTPEAIPVLYPAIMRELCYWLLTGPNGGEVCKIVRAESHTRRIADSIYFLRKNFDRQIRVEEMAAAANMSMSSFHHHFRTVTALTPVQFQKQLRLLEARRLMITGAASVTRAAFQVGYESASQFSREYARMFGAPPKRDSEAMKKLVSGP